ncbi:MAG: DciA family protein [Candidatus Limnocylindrales bacterium]
MNQPRRPMRRLGDVLPAIASELGLDAELRLARAMATWARLVEEHVPVAAGASTLLSVEPPSLNVSASSPMVAQELRLRSDELLSAFASAPGGSRLLELHVLVRPHQPPGGGRAARQP